MEWAPWQRIELDIQGDHIMPFVLGGQFHVAWPLIRRNKGESGDDTWEVKLAWSRYDGKSWRKSNLSRDFWSGEALPFSEEREGFAFRCEASVVGDWVKIFIYALAKIAGTTKTKQPSIMGLPEDLILQPDYQPTSANDIQRVSNLANLINQNYAHIPAATEATTASERLKALVQDNYPALPQGIKDHFEVFRMAYGHWRVPPDL
jgi:hypothetical protein